jgi:hypothetical protein
MDEVTVEFRPDGSVTIPIDDKTVHWRPPKVKHMRAFRNQQAELAERISGMTAELRDATFDTPADETRTVMEFRERIETEVIGWVRAVDQALAIPDSADLPIDEGEWPVWLPTLDFTRALVRHWLANPFASAGRSTPPEPTGTGR